MNQLTEVSAKTVSDGVPVPSVQTPNTVALIGAVLNGVAIVFCISLFVLADGLPSDRQQFQEQLAGDSSEKLRLLIVGCCAVLLLVISLVLSLIGLFLPHRPRLLAAIGTASAAILLAGIFGTLLIGVAMSP